MEPVNTSPYCPPEAKATENHLAPQASDNRVTGSFPELSVGPEVTASITSHFCTYHFWTYLLKAQSIVVTIYRQHSLPSPCLLPVTP